jgi:GAF domain-containing protein
MKHPAIAGAVKATAERISDSILARSGAEFSLVYLREGATDNMTIVAHSGGFPGARMIRKLDFRVGQKGTGGPVTASGIARLCNDYLLEYPDSPFRGIALEVGVRSLVIAPMGPKGRASGCLYLIHRQPNRFTPEDRERLEAAADLAEIAVDNALAAARAGGRRRLR